MHYNFSIIMYVIRDLIRNLSLSKCRASALECLSYRGMENGKVGGLDKSPKPNWLGLE